MPEKPFIGKQNSIPTVVAKSHSKIFLGDILLKSLTELLVNPLLIFVKMLVRKYVFHNNQTSSIIEAL